jgi:hypothetical protein
MVEHEPGERTNQRYRDEQRHASPLRAWLTACDGLPRVTVDALSGAREEGCHRQARKDYDVPEDRIAYTGDKRAARRRGAEGDRDDRRSRQGTPEALRRLIIHRFRE